MSFLIDSGAEVNARDNEGVTYLLEAVEREEIEIVMSLLQHSADVNVVRTASDGASALDIAVQMQSAPIVDLLLGHGAPVDGLPFQEIAPIQNAYHNYELLEVLLRHGASIEGNPGAPSPLARILANALGPGTDPYNVVEEIQRITLLLLSHGAKASFPFLISGMRALDQEAFGLLLERTGYSKDDPSNPFPEYTSKEEALSYLLWEACSIGVAPIVELLVNAGADVNHLVVAQETLFPSPLLAAIAYNDYLIEFLLVFSFALRSNKELINSFLVLLPGCRGTEMK